jgi:hypothetical protein
VLLSQFFAFLFFFLKMGNYSVLFYRKPSVMNLKKIMSVASCRNTSTFVR